MPDSREKLLGERIKTMLASCANFQAWVEAEDAEEAAARIWLEGVTGVALGSGNGAVIRLHDISYGRETRSGFNLWASGMVHIETRSVVTVTYSETLDLEAVMASMMESVRLFKWDFMGLSEANTNVQFGRVTELPGPMVDEEKIMALLERRAGEIEMIWGFSAELIGNG